MCSDPVDPGGEVRGCCVGCTIAMSDVSPFVFIVTAGKNIGFLELKKCFFKRRCFECGGICWCSDWHKIVFFVSAPLDVSLNVMPHTASRRSLLPAARSSSRRRPRAQEYTSSLVIPCAHGKLNVKHHRTTPKPEIRIYQYHSRERRSRAGQKIEHQNVHRRRSRRSASIYIRVYTSETDFLKPGMYGGSVGVRANAWDVFRRTPSRGGRGRRAAVDFVVCFGCGGI